MADENDEQGTAANQKKPSNRAVKPETVKVRVARRFADTKEGKAEVSQPLHEAGQIYKPGDVFETTAERAEALGDSVEKIG